MKETNSWEYALNAEQAEVALRTMAKETRFNRRVMGQRIDDIIRTTPNDMSRAQVVQSPSGIVYVFFITPRTTSRDERRAELGNRCLVARDLVPSAKTVVGIATETYDPTEPGSSFDVCYIHCEEWTPDQHKQAQEIREKFGWFPDDRKRHVHIDEYYSETPTEIHRKYTTDTTSTRNVIGSISMLLHA